MCQLTVSKKKGLVNYELTNNHVLPSKDLKELDDPSDRVHHRGTRVALLIAA